MGTMTEWTVELVAFDIAAPDGGPLEVTHHDLPAERVLSLFSVLAGSPTGFALRSWAGDYVATFDCDELPAHEAVERLHAAMR